MPLFEQMINAGRGILEDHMRIKEKDEGTMTTGKNRGDGVGGRLGGQSVKDNKIGQF